MPTLRITEISIGERVRKDMGDIAGLAESIKRHGLLHPVVVRGDGALIAGHRRIEAMKLLGWSDVPVTVVEVADLLGAERDENVARKDFTPTEAVAIGRLIEEEHRAKIEATRSAMARAAGLRSAAKRAGNNEVKDAAVPAPLGNTAEVAGAAVGMSAASYRRARAVVAAAEADPEKFGDLLERMDESKNVLGAHREMQRRKAAPAAKKPRHAIHGRAPYRKPNREIERAIIALDGICDLLETIPIEELNQPKVAAWAESFKEFGSRLNRFARRING